MKGLVRLSSSRGLLFALVLLLVVKLGGVWGAIDRVEAHPSRRLVKIREAPGVSLASRDGPVHSPPTIIGVDREDAAWSDAIDGSWTIEWSEPDYIATAALSNPTSDPITPWSFEEINMTGAWDITKGDDNQTVCVIDSGIDASHPDLQGAIGEGYDAIFRRSGHVDTNGHGTMVAGVLAASPDNGLGIPGVLWGGRIDSCRFLGDDGRGYLSNAIECMRWCIVEREARIVSNSWGTYGRSRALRDVMEYYAEAYGVIYVAAAGNERVDNDNESEAMYPASYNLSSIVSVAATTRLGTLASFSNYASKGKSVDIAAPGVDIVSTFPANTYRSMSGTSFAVPLVTGTLALMMSASTSSTGAYANLASKLPKLLLDSSQRSPMLSGVIAGGRYLDASRSVNEAVSFVRDMDDSGPRDDRIVRMHPSLEDARIIDATPFRDGSRYEEAMQFPGEAVLNKSALSDIIFADCPSSRYPRYDVQGMLGDVLIPKHVFVIENTDALGDRFRYLQLDTCSMASVFDSVLVVLDCERGESLHNCRCLRSNDGCKRRRAGSKVRATLSTGHVYVAIVFGSDPVESGSYSLRLVPQKRR